MAPTKSKKNAAAAAGDATHAAAAHAHEATPKKAAAEPHHAANAHANAGAGFVFGVNLEDPRDVEDESSVLAPIAKYAILGMICLMSFAIRLFAVVRYESVRCMRHDRSEIWRCMGS